MHTASAAFERVALYFENSILAPDLPLLAASASTVDRLETAGVKLVVDSLRGTGIAWQGPALVDGKPWPVASDTTVWLPRGTHSVEHAAQQPSLRLLDFNGELKSAGVVPGGVEFAYQSGARAMVMLDRTPGRLEIDGAEAQPQMAGKVLILPRGQHVVTLQNAALSTER